MLLNKKRLTIVAYFVGGLVWISCGCSGSPSRVRPPAYSAEAGAAAIDAYDRNGDNVLDASELNRVPALRASLNQVDTDGNGKLTAAEIDSRILSWQQARIGEMTVNCQVLLDGSSLEGASVEFEPESFLGSGLRPGTATTGANGDAAVSMPSEYLADPRYSGMACGWYKIRVTKSGLSIPKRFNTQTTLGCEVAMDAHWVGQDQVLIKLESR